MAREFFQWPTDYDDYLFWCRKTGQKPRKREDYWVWRQEQCAREWNHYATRNAAEMIWIKAGQPYYNIHPDLVSQFARVNLSKVPTKLVELPHKCKAVSLRFAQQHPELTLTEDMTKIQPRSFELANITAGSWVHSFLMLRPTEIMLRSIGVRDMGERTSDELVMLLIDFNLQMPDGRRTLATCPLLWVGDESLEQTITALSEIGTDKTESYKHVVRNCLRVAVTVGFLANSNDELVDPDVLSKDRFNYEHGSPEQRKTIVDRARRRGKVGYNVGNDMIFLGQAGFARSGESQEERERRELQYAHIRAGHPHAVRYGPKHSLVKIQWWRPTVVRPDLPFKKGEA